MILVRALLLITAVLLPSPGLAEGAKVLRFGVVPDYPPFSFVDENNRFQGFEVELGQALCANLEVRCEFVKQDWDDMIPALLAYRFDAILASMSITEQRKQQVAFTDHYYRTPASFAALKAANLRDTSPAAMKGRVIGAQMGTVHAAYLEKAYRPAGAQIRLFKTQQEAQLELARGRLDALLADKAGFADWLAKTEQGRCCALAGPDVTDASVVGDGVGIALRKEDAELKERLNRALDSVLADGTYKEINDRYFPFPVY